MKITQVQLYQYSLPLLMPLTLGEKSIMTREGFLVKITAQSNEIGISEISPLPGFSKESLDDVVQDVLMFRNEFIGNTVPSDILERTNRFAPSVQFGLETALLNLHASYKNLTLVDLLNPNAKRVIGVNALLTGSINEIESKLEFLMLQGYKTFKIKVGRNKLTDEISLIKRVASKLDDSFSIRLDANRKFTYEDGCKFLNEIKDCSIEYIEEPFQKGEDMLKLLKNEGSSIPVGLDETLREIRPDELEKYKLCKAVILKPTLVGYAHAVQFAKSAIALEITPVISSSFESSIGIYVLASIAGVIDDSISVGLETISWFAEDVIEEPVSINQGSIYLDDYVHIFDQIDFKKFQEIPLD